MDVLIINLLRTTWQLSKVLMVVLILLSVFSCQEKLTMGDIYQKITLTKADSALEFQVTEKVVRADKDKVYWWFKGGELHKQRGGFAGKLLNGEYAVYDMQGNLKTSGSFKNGLKHGVWKKWIEGELQSVVQYRRGARNGKFWLYEDGSALLTGRYRDGEKDGLFLYQTDSIETMIKYKKGNPTDTTTTFYNLFQSFLILN